MCCETKSKLPSSTVPLFVIIKDKLMMVVSIFFGGGLKKEIDLVESGYSIIDRTVGPEGRSTFTRFQVTCSQLPVYVKVQSRNVYSTRSLNR